MCTSIIAGKRATDEGVVLLSRNEDFPTDNCWNKHMVYRDKPGYAAGPSIASGSWVLGNGLVVPIPKRQFAYNAMPDAAGYEESTRAIGNRFFFEERGINEKNFAISATNSLAMNAKVEKIDPLLISEGVAESVIPTLLLPQAVNALDGVRLLGHYIETYGGSEVNGVLFGDPNEAWYFENGSAHHWIAVRVPQDKFMVIANGMRVHSVNLNDKENVRHSKGLYEFVVRHKLLNKADADNFDFAKAFGQVGVAYNNDRIWLAQKLLSPSIKQKPGKMRYPLFLKSDRKISVKDVMRVLRATYEGTVLRGRAKRPIGVCYTAESHIITLDSSMPHALRGIIWQATSTPLGAPYMPLYSVTNQLPGGFSSGLNEYDPLSAYWLFKGLYELSNYKKGPLGAALETYWQNYESQSILEIKSMNKMLRTLSRSNKAAAIAFAKRYSTGIAYQTISMADALRNSTMTLITKNQHKKVMGSQNAGL